MASLMREISSPDPAGAAAAGAAAADASAATAAGAAAAAAAAASAAASAGAAASVGEPRAGGVQGEPPGPWGFKVNCPWWGWFG